MTRTGRAFRSWAARIARKIDAGMCQGLDAAANHLAGIIRPPAVRAVVPVRCRVVPPPRQPGR